MILLAQFPLDRFDRGAKLRIVGGKEAEFAKISYTNDVVPILKDKCVDCHQPNGIAPWHMSNYQQVKTFAPMIREALRTKRMPARMADNRCSRGRPVKRRPARCHRIRAPMTVKMEAA